MPRQGATRAWCFTLNNYTPEEEKVIQAFACDYMVYGHEVGENGTQHLQGYVFVRRKASLKQLKEHLSDRAHFEQAKGNAHQNYQYCTKQDTAGFFEKGDRPKQGQRSDFVLVKELVKAGGEMPEIIEIASSYQGLRTAELLLKYRQAPADPSRDDWVVKWFWGDTGAGKSYTAREEAKAHKDGSYYVNASQKEQWWDGYTNQQTIILDDLRGSWCPFSRILQLLDIYTIQLQIKGSSGWRKCTQMIVTSNKHPRDVWAKRTEEDIEQLLRRITIIREFRKQGRRPAAAAPIDDERKDEGPMAYAPNANFPVYLAESDYEFARY